ncbi:MAG: hypothetical protein J6W30_02675 [Bacteroidales bacterium]|nr:hypothetical protein [Bacteroidales bacterium]
MKSKNLIIGLLVLFFGVVTLLSTLNVFDFHWSIVWRLWPMILVIFGITLLPLNDYIKGALVLAALGVGCLLYNVEAKHYQGNAITRFYNNIKSWDIYGDEDEKEDDDDGIYAVDQHFSEPFTDIEHASIDIDFGAGDLTLKDPCAELAKVDAQSNFVKYSFRTETGDDKTSIFVSGRGHTKRVGKRNENDLEIALCALPVWDFSLDMGAADADLDFSPYKVASIDIDGGACDLDLKLGDSGCDTKVEISTGASDIDIKVPTGVDCEINLESAITEKDFTGFEKISRGLWRTPNFGQGSHKIVIDMNCAVSNISVVRY